MKRLLSLLLTLALGAALAVPALAAQETEETKELTTEEGLAPLEFALTDAQGQERDYPEVSCDLKAGTYTAYNDAVTIKDLTGYYAVMPGTKVTVSNLGGDRDCYIRVSVREYRPMTRAQIVSERELTVDEAYHERSNLFAELTSDSAVAYMGDYYGAYLRSDNTWAEIYEIGYDDLKRVEEDQSLTFSLPNPEEGKLYRVQLEVCYPAGSQPESAEADEYFYRYLTLRMDSEAAKPAETDFTDVAPNAYYADAVAWAVGEGITTGTTDTTFSPNNTCTTGQILTFLWRAVGSPAPKGPLPLSDLRESDYYYRAAWWAHEEGLVSGTVLGGGTPCTRSAVMTYLWKLAGSPEAQPAAFTDVAADADYAQAVAWAVEQGITTGTTETTFDPDAVCTRGQIVTFLYRDLAQ